VALALAISTVAVRRTDVRGRSVRSPQRHREAECLVDATGATFIEQWWASAVPEDKAVVEQAGRDSDREIEVEPAETE
jgi:hypothetical protein